MKSQSFENLPDIYQPFDLSREGHWADRGMCLDYILTARKQGSNFLDFGCGDGWPSLQIAPYVDKITGVDASASRILESIHNARKLNINNAFFVKVPQDGALPFADGQFDGVFAASSIEQTNDPQKTIKELWRVLKPGGLIKFYFEAIESKEAKPYESFAFNSLNNKYILLLIHYDLKASNGLFYRLEFKQDKEAFACYDYFLDEKLNSEIETSQVVQNRAEIKDVSKGLCCFPTVSEWRRHLEMSGFVSILLSYSGGLVGERLFRALQGLELPRNKEELDSILTPLVSFFACKNIAAERQIPGKMIYLAHKPHKGEGHG
jgi:ubiquinone/menaquinone biosynthesis C-methylase UbiE